MANPKGGTKMSEDKKRYEQAKVEYEELKQRFH